ncbi:MAG: hypothetical protein ABIH86_05590 [Planctomycetota bacterium]
MPLSSNPWLLLGLCPDPAMLSNSALLEDLIDAAARVMKKHLHPDRTGGNSDAFIAAQDARDSLNDSLVRRARAMQLNDAIAGGQRVRDQLDQQRDIAARAIAELSLTKISLSKEKAARETAEQALQDRNARIRELETELKTSKRDVEQSARLVKEVIERQQALLDEHTKVVEAEKAKISEQVETLTGAVSQSAELVKTAYEELKTLRRDRLELDETLRRTRSRLSDEERRAVPFILIGLSVLASIAAAGFGYAYPDTLVAHLIITGIVWSAATLFGVMSATDMMRRLNRLSWAGPAAARVMRDAAAAPLTGTDGDVQEKIQE